jgi:hypothetical protein
MLQAPHLRVHGKSQGRGKTNLIQTLAAGAVRTGARLVVLDRRRFKDWGAFDGRADLVDTRDPAPLRPGRACACAPSTRSAMPLLSQHGAPNIAALEQPPQRMVVVISEFGALCGTAQAEGVLDDVLYPLSLILREAGGRRRACADRGPGRRPALAARHQRQRRAGHGLPARQLRRGRRLLRRAQAWRPTSFILAGRSSVRGRWLPCCRRCWRAYSGRRRWWAAFDQPFGRSVRWRSLQR